MTQERIVVSLRGFAGMNVHKQREIAGKAALMSLMKNVASHRIGRLPSTRDAKAAVPSRRKRGVSPRTGIWLPKPVGKAAKLRKASAGGA